MVSIGTIKIKRIIEHHILPPVFEPVVKGPAYPAQVSAPIPKHVPLSLMPPGRGGGTETSTVKHVSKSIVENVSISDNVNRTKTAGVTGFSYTQTSFTLTSYTISGVAITKTLATESVTVGAGTVGIQRAKRRALEELEAGVQEVSQTVKAQRGKTRAIAETVDVIEIIGEARETAKSKNLAETVNITESPTTMKHVSRSLAVESVVSEEDLTFTLPSLLRILVESEDITDSVAYETTYASGHIPKNITETVEIAEAVTIQTSKRRAPAIETDNITDNVIRHVTITLTSFTDTSFTQESWTVIIRNEKTLIETEEMSETVRISMTKNRGLPTEDVTIIG